MIVISGYKDDQLLEETTLSLNEYHDGENPLIDDGEYRQSKGVNKVLGFIGVDESDSIDERFENRYDNEGRLVASDKYNSELLLVDTSRIYYDFNKHIDYCELNAKAQNGKLNAMVRFSPKRKLKFIVTINLMEFDGGVFSNAGKFSTTETPKMFLDLSIDFDIKPDAKYRLDVNIEVYDGNAVLEKSEIVSNVLVGSFDSQIPELF